MSDSVIPDSMREALASGNRSLALLVQSGSRAYGIEQAGSDDDYLGVFVSPLRSFVSLDGPGPDTLAGNDPDFTLHEIGKFCRLALKGNPAILETLWNPNLLACDAWGRELISIRSKCLHRGSLKVYVEYAQAQLKKMVKGSGLHAKGGSYNGKFGAHLVRLLHAGIQLAETGEVQVRASPTLAGTLMEIRTAKRSMNDVMQMSHPLLEKLGKLSEANTLPIRPDEVAFNDLVVRARLFRE
jgi:predicted nucleotidyltransferase